MSFIEKINQINAESNMPSRSEIESALKSDAKELASKDKSREEAAKSILGRQGIKTPTEEEIKKIPDEEITREIENVAFANILARLRSSASESATAIYKNHLETYNELYPANADSISQNIVDASEYGQNLSLAKSMLDEMKRTANSLEL